MPEVEWDWSKGLGAWSWWCLCSWEHWNTEQSLDTDDTLADDDQRRSEEARRKKILRLNYQQDLSRRCCRKHDSQCPWSRRGAQFRKKNNNSSIVHLDILHSWIVDCFFFIWVVKFQSSQLCHRDVGDVLNIADLLMMILKHWMMMVIWFIIHQRRRVRPDTVSWISVELSDETAWWRGTLVLIVVLVKIPMMMIVHTAVRT